MTTAIKSSLSKLDSALQNLESSLSVAQSKKEEAATAAPKAPQNDLFGAGTPSNDAKALASRLDGAISKVERLLREDSAHG